LLGGAQQLAGLGNGGSGKKGKEKSARKRALAS
jgi:hypothetical protein